MASDYERDAQPCEPLLAAWRQEDCCLTRRQALILNG